MLSHGRYWPRANSATARAAAIETAATCQVNQRGSAAAVAAVNGLVATCKAECENSGRAALGAVDANARGWAPQAPATY